METNKRENNTPPSQEEEKKKPLHPLGKVNRLIVTILILSLFLSSATLYTWANRMEAGKARSFFLEIIAPLHRFNTSLKLHNLQQGVKKEFRALAGIKTEEGWEAAFSVEKPVSTPEPTATLRPTFTPKPEIRYSSTSPLQILLLGDSMVAESLSSMFGKKVEQNPTISYEKTAHYSSGLSRPDFYNWPAQVNAIYKEKRFDLVVVMLGMNDAQNINYEDTLYSYGTEAWFNLYRQRVADFVKQILSHSKRVYWLGPPIMRLTRYNKRMEQLNHLYEDICGEIENATYIPTNHILSGGEMRYTDYLTIDNKLQKVRTGDGIHFTLAGAALVVDKVIEKINENYQFDYITPSPEKNEKTTTNNEADKDYQTK